ncbi:MAG TPA: alpha/beta fold hydrolase [Polyangiaceae bacterium]|nr:alpha/beta fold hydrolase [Polyangiaceae bacterium]
MLKRILRTALALTALTACDQKAARTETTSNETPTTTAADAAQATTAKAPPAPKSPPPKPDPTLPGEAEGDFIVKDFRFASGETLPELRLHYTTLGAPHQDAQGHVDNAVLLLHGTTARGKAFFVESFRSAMFGPGQPLDTTKYFVILPDNVGAGQSSKPSEQLRARFPHYAYGDMLALQHRLVTEKLGLSHLRLVIGNSMGGMHTWMWAEKYPDMMDAAVPIACEPTRIAGRNLLWRRMMIETTKTDPAYNGGDYTEQPRGYVSMLPLFYMMVDSPARFQESLPDMDKATAFVHGDFGAARAPLDANDALYALDASRDYDPEPDLGKIKTNLLAINFADDEINVASLGDLERLVPHVHGGHFVLVPASARTHGHMTQMQAAEWQTHVATLLQKGK